MIAIVDYGAGNISSVKKALEHIGAETKLTDDPTAILTAKKIVVPGVGHFCRCDALNLRMRSALLEAIANGTPFLGICVGMQWLFEGSTEAPETLGAGLFSGHCSRFPSTVKSPHVGWNRLALHGDSQLLRGIEDRSFVYYTHSFRAPMVEQAIARTSYGGLFPAAVERGNVYGVQFHPEKSGRAGLRILENFCAI
ncbi:MAG TPA: imidazole glycerol phosphate synthase subunit HisH [Candidatus Angelobacter sp.]|nr:imidazole glycerol phosphate synthase subunit HisH [Candidatus Angelobacter sp.]